MNPQEITEEVPKGVEEFISYWHKELKSYHGRKARIIRYRELAWYKELSRVFAFIFFLYVVIKYEGWSLLIIPIVVVPYVFLFRLYRDSISKKPEPELNKFIDSNEDTKDFTDDSEPPRQSFYSGVTRKESDRYQAYFDKTIESIDVANLLFSRTKKFRFNQKKADHDRKIIERTLKEAEAEEELSPFLLKVMIEQYLWAEPREREIDRGVWVKRVMNRNELDYFPLPEKINELLLKE